ncbi:histidine kinase dimerization/phospho-acceptor domain-containing protein [uncultured Clostridium sp.]|uniref:histidine kinase dimerization/phospho-acceptor domain-containing protein n=1 Tax=uncultured Clostridium sp. TaxID=59620 RepID=UPI0025DCDB0D|nr:histidine kinase dimerization/phospho-acceptor domain-containing protein [uncultured Clostridium sp.]MDU4884600.1 histidine kinase dimerization/phospho-acceptor domain-containing protein [Clostridium celatum]MDU7078188.1 histidine kinase dimerization/phospho-acceptor domain-containing protein [Clostridium celatum]
MDTKSKSINKEKESKSDIKKEKNNIKKSFKNNTNTKFIIYILTVITLVITILSGLEVKDNLIYVIPDRIYTQTQVAEKIYDYTNLAQNYSLYYKSSTYTDDKNNITQNDIQICKAELQSKADNEYEEYRNDKYNDSSFNNLTYEQQEKILNEEREKVNEKYTLSDEEMTEYVLNRKSNSARDLNNKIKSYVNLNFRAYDKLNDIWIGGDEIEVDAIKKDSSRYFKEINIDYNGNLIEKIYVNGKEIKRNNALTKFIDNYSYGSRFFGYISTEINYNSEEKHNLTLYIWMPTELQSGDVVYESFIEVQKNVNSFYLSCILFIVFFILLIVCILYLAKNNKKSLLIEGIVNKFKVYPIEYNIGVAMLAWIIWNNGLRIYNNSNNYIRRLNFSSIIWGIIVVVIYYLLIRIIISKYNEGTLFKNNITIKIWNYLSDVMNRGSIIRTFVIMIALYILSGLALLFLSAWLWIWPIGLAVGLVLTIIYIVMLIKDLVYLDKIMVGAKAAAEGKLNYKIDEKGRGHLRELAHDINNIKDGLKKSVENEMKSENMKTELITNVSHDLKTPLTSIINYIDLLKRENIEPENARDYVNILDKKSQRLKVLIEDLFEASKAASGAMELNISRIDIGQLLKQALGENDERFKDNRLEVKLNIPDDKIFIDGDGKRLYRVFENLISNIVKYSLSNTRVYIDMFKENDEVIIVMKNISAYELSFDTNEITNRFKRGDASRSTEGSGLGLAIAKSIVELHNGSFKIEADGDLFKSIIKLK